MAGIDAPSLSRLEQGETDNPTLCTPTGVTHAFCKTMHYVLRDGPTPAEAAVTPAASRMGTKTPGHEPGVFALVAGTPRVENRQAYFTLAAVNLTPGPCHVCPVNPDGTRGNGKDSCDFS